MSSIHNVAFLIGRVIVGGFFLMNGFSGYAFALGISGHHVELREVVKTVHKEKTTSDDTPDEERNVVDTVHNPSSQPLG